MVTKKEQRKYTEEYKKGGVKLSREIGRKRAAAELDVPESTLYGWIKSAEKGGIDLGIGQQTPGTAMTLAEEIRRQKAENAALKKENAKLKEMNEFLEEAASFFAASRQKSGKKNGSNS